MTKLDTTPVEGGRQWRIGVVFGPLGKVKQDALRYLILHLNLLQQHFEFELTPSDPRDPLIRLLASASADCDSVREELPCFGERLRKELRDLIAGYACSEEDLPDHFVILSTARFSNNYYSARNEACSVIALGNWERSMAPPSILEFFVMFVMREAIALAAPALSGSVHLGTKGCLLDFTMLLAEARYKVLNGHLCSFCRSEIVRSSGTDLADSIAVVLSQNWIGSRGDPRSPASIVEKLGHDLFRTKGLTPSFWERTRATLEQEGIKQILTLGGGIILAALLLYLGLRG